MDQMYNSREDFDNLAWDKNDEEWKEAQKQLRRQATYRKVESLVRQKYGKPATISVEGTSDDVMVRLPCPGLAQFPDENSLSEAATAKFVAGNTTVPISKILFSGQNSDLGSFIVLPHVKNRWTLSHALTDPRDDPDTPHKLHTKFSESTLERLYGKAATGDDGSFSVAGRPIIQNMNNMLQLANVPRSVLPPTSRTYTTTDEWYIALAEMHIAQLVFQHNDLVTSADDYRNKYVARQIFLKLAKEGKLSTFGFKEDNWSAQHKFESTELSPAPDKTCSFWLWCDDFRPGNILLNDEEDVVAMIDWEFAYAAPAQFVLDPPWWLLLDIPEMWEDGIDNWVKTYSRHLETWLVAMQRAEESFHLVGDTLPFKLAEDMRESCETGRFLLNYAARKSWTLIFSGDRGNDILKNELWKTRINLLGDDKRRAMGPFVERKMEEMKQRVLVERHEENTIKELGIERPADGSREPRRAHRNPYYQGGHPSSE
ncbi:phosphotransferase [Halenospora varia]|nr:phosphotransferase [Halenospora varia]